MNNNSIKTHNIYHIGRNILKDDIGYYLTFSDGTKISKSHHSTFASAKRQMDYQLKRGWIWFDVYEDPTL